jgi:sugar lactone lactonase YvrE
MAGFARLGLGLLCLSACSDRALYLPLVARVDAGTPQDLSTAAASDLAVPDLGAAHDLAARDLAMHDLAARDLSGDLAPPRSCSTVTVSTHPGTFGPLDGIALDGAGYVYVGDAQAFSILKVAPDGTPTTLAGNINCYCGPVDFFNDGTGGPNGTAEFHSIADLQLDHLGNLIVADYLNQRIRKVAPDGTTTTIAGNGTYGYFDGTGGANGTTEFTRPAGVAVDSAGYVYVADYWNARLRKVAPDGTTTTLAGNGTAGSVDGTGGPNGTAELANPIGVAVDSAGNLYVTESKSGSFPPTINRLRKVAPDGTTTTLAGSGAAGHADGTGGRNGTATFNTPAGVAVDGDGNVYVVDSENDSIRKVAPDGTTSTLAGDGTPGHVDGDGCIARFISPRSLTLYGKRLLVLDIIPADGGLGGFAGIIREIQLP